MTLFLLNISPFTINASSWRKAADLVAQGTPANPQVQAAATAESKQLESLPLSALSADDSSPPQVTCDSQQPIATSTPRATSTSIPETPTETYCQIILGMSDHLYPTLVADGLLGTHVADNVVLLHCGCLSLNPFIEFRIQNNSSSSDVLYIQASRSISPKYESK